MKDFELIFVNLIGGFFMKYVINSLEIH